MTKDLYSGLPHSLNHLCRTVSSSLPQAAAATTRPEVEDRLHGRPCRKSHRQRPLLLPAEWKNRKIVCTRRLLFNAEACRGLSWREQQRLTKLPSSQSIQSAFQKSKFIHGFYCIIWNTRQGNLTLVTWSSSPKQHNLQWRHQVYANDIKYVPKSWDSFLYH